MAYEGNCRLGDLFENRRESGSPELPLLSVTMNDGLVDRSELDRKQDTNLAPEEHILVEPGDIAYNMMRMWQGASGLADKRGMVSPAYVVLARKNKTTIQVNLRYVSYLFKSPRMIYLFWAYSYGLTSDRLRLYFKDLAKIPVSIPEVAEQEKVVQILSATDRVKDVLHELIKINLVTKRALIQQLVSGEKRLRGFADRIKKDEFSNFCDLIKDKVDPQRADNSLRCIELDNMTSLTGELQGFTHVAEQLSAKGVFACGDVLFGKLRPYLRKYWLADSAGYCSTEIWVLRAKQSRCLPTYLHLICQTDRFAKACHVVAGSKMPRAEWPVVSKTPFLLPSLEEQAAIVNFISATSREFRSLTQNSNLLTQQKHALMQHVFENGYGGQSSSVART